MCNCKCAKWWPHNWFCLKTLYWIFVVFFYIALITLFYSAFQLVKVPAAEYASAGLGKWMFMFNSLTPMFLGLIITITLAKIIKVLHSIKHAVAPCCQVKAESNIEKTVVEESK